MAEEIIILSVAPDAAEHAERFGAKFDPKTVTWFVVGPVPRELLNYVPREENQHFQEVAPRCPRCGAPTRKRIDSSGDPFWSCATHFKTGCKGTIDYADYLNDVAPVARISAFLPKLAGSLFGPQEAPTTTKEEAPHPLKAKWREIVQEAAAIIGNDKQAVRWLYEPKVAFHGKTPIEMCATEAGCHSVLALLREVWK